MEESIKGKNMANLISAIGADAFFSCCCCLIGRILNSINFSLSKITKKKKTDY